MLKQVVYTVTTEHYRVNLLGNINAITKHRPLLDTGRKVGVDVSKKKNKCMFMFHHQNPEHNHKVCSKTRRWWQSSDIEEQQQFKTVFVDKLKVDQIQGKLATNQFRLKHVKL
jgi:hypothetical protein